MPRSCTYASENTAEIERISGNGVSERKKLTNNI